MRIIHEKIDAIRGNLVTVSGSKAGLGELARIEIADGRTVYASVVHIDGEKTTLQVFQNTHGISTGDRVVFLRRRPQATYSSDLLGRRMNGSGDPIDGGAEILGTPIDIGGPSINPVRRIVPNEMVRTNIPMIDLFNCLVKSQKISIFSVAGEPYNKLLMRIANQVAADVVIIGGMGLTFSEYQAFVDHAESSGRQNKTVMFVHTATDPTVECLLVPDMALACAERFALEHKNVMVMLTDMTVFADALREISFTMDQIPANRGYPSSLYSDLAARYEKAVAVENGSITILTATTMPGNDITHPIPDNTGYITDGQLCLSGGRIDPMGSLSRLKQNVIGKCTREDHGELANAMIRLYAESKKAAERHAMGFCPSRWDVKLLHFAKLFEKQLMDLNVNCPLEQALDVGWKILQMCFAHEEVGIKETILEKFWDRTGAHHG